MKNNKYKYEELFQRNIGIVSEKEQNTIKNSTIVIAGVGGDGGLIAETMARAGVGNIKVADPEVFEKSNVNRQNGCNTTTFGRNKADVIGEIVKKINPFCKVEVFNKGINQKNVSEFLSGADILIDESEFTKHEIAVMLAREARKNKIPLITGFNIGFGAFVFSFPPEGITFEKYLGLSSNMQISEIASQEVAIHKWCPWLPKYGDEKTLRDIEANKIPVPGISPSVSLVSAIVVTETLMFILGKKKLIPMPRYIWVDLEYRRTKVRRAGKISFFFSYMLMKLKH